MPTLQENEKYELIQSDKTTPNGKPLFRVKAKRNIGKFVKTGDLGGYIENANNLSVYDDARVYGNAWVSIRANIKTDINFEIPRITIDTTEKLDRLVKVLNQLKEE